MPLLAGIKQIPPIIDQNVKYPHLIRGIPFPFWHPIRLNPDASIDRDSVAVAG